MKILKISRNKIYFCISDEKCVLVRNIQRDDLIQMLRNIYMNKDYYEDIESELDNIEDIPNAVEKEISDQILRKLIDFRKNVDSVKNSIESSFKDKY
ncbi:hypothetical protein MUDAN_IGPPGNFN_02067 [Lactiplantibacillus mudanjiangensis]|nr:hypothetical protein MUDAN_IGPPGNFN_02067 [Lactiplantibacillus mudanjiangensis]